MAARVYSLSLSGIGFLLWSIPRCPSSVSWFSRASRETVSVCFIACICECSAPHKAPLQQQTEQTGRGSRSLSLAEPENAARRTFANFSAVCSIDGVAEGMLTQHESSPFPALFLPPLLFLSLSRGTLFPSLFLSLSFLLFPSDPLSLHFRCQRPDLPVKPDQSLAVFLAAPHADWLLTHSLCIACVLLHAVGCGASSVLGIHTLYSGLQNTFRKGKKTLLQTPTQFSVGPAKGEILEIQ